MLPPTSTLLRSSSLVPRTTGRLERSFHRLGPRTDWRVRVTIPRTIPSPPTTTRARGTSVRMGYLTKTLAMMGSITTRTPWDAENILWLPEVDSDASAGALGQVSTQGQYVPSLSTGRPPAPAEFIPKRVSPPSPSRWLNAH